LKPAKWDPRLFLRVSRLPASRMKGRAYQAACELQSRMNLKTLREWEVFIAFSRTVGVAVDPANVVMLDPNSSYPPPPDVEYRVAPRSYFFEMGEIIQEDSAQVLSPKKRRLIMETEPLTKMWDPLWEILIKKLRKSYSPQARPIALLLYYDNGPSHWEFLRPLVNEKIAEIQERVDASIFDNVWLFDATQREMLFRVARTRLHLKSA
jgi:hypothetical protein